MTHAHGHLIRQVDRWTEQTLVSGRFLVRLYRHLQDDHQAAAALEVMAPSEARAARLGLAVPDAPRPVPVPESAEAEADAWARLLEAQAGLCSFHAMVEGPRGPMRAAERAYRRALRGLATAFPADWAAAIRHGALAKVSDLCADLFLADLDGEGTPAQRDALREVIVTGIREGLAPPGPAAGETAQVPPIPGHPGGDPGGRP